MRTVSRCLSKGTGILGSKGGLEFLSRGKQWFDDLVAKQEQVVAFKPSGIGSYLRVLPIRLTICLPRSFFRS
jgi:hypothetical protein